MERLILLNIHDVLLQYLLDMRMDMQEVFRIKAGY